MFFIIGSVIPVQGQGKVITKDSVVISTDTLSRIVDSLGNDSLRKVGTTKLEDSLGIRISKDALPAIVNAEAVDSAVIDIKHNKFRLHGNAKVSYQDLKLGAGKITFEQATNIVTAEPAFDSLGAIVERPTFAQGSELVTYDSLLYNFKTKRAIIRNARSKYGEGFVFSTQIKRNPDQSIYGWKNIYTTCALDTPHFGIWANKIKIIPNQVIAAGSAHVVIEGVPTPVFLPFGLFPISQGQRTGFRIPTYTIEQQRGLGLTNGGYYFYLNDYVDLLFLASIYSKGSWNGSLISTYANRYHYNGGLSVSYAYNKIGESYEPGSSIGRQFMINWRHQTDAKAKPGETFNASVQVGSSNYFQQNSYNPNQILNNQYNSNITYSKNWINKPYSFSMAVRHSQNTQTHIVDLTLPAINFYISQFNPFHNKNVTGIHWYDKITMGYTLTAANQVSFIDSTFGSSVISLDKFHNGIKHAIPVSASYTVARFINMSFNAAYNEYWLTQQRYQLFNTGPEYKLDTITNRGFFTARDFTASMAFSTRIYGLKMFKHGKLQGIRHVVTPAISLNYTPDYARYPFHYYYQTYLSPNTNPTFLNIYDGSVVGVPGLGQYGSYSSSIGYNLNNNLQIKLRGKDSSAGKNVTLIDALSLAGSYNIAADSFNWSPLSINFRTNILNVFNLTGDAVFDPYAFDYETGVRSTHTMWDQNRSLPRFTTGHLGLSASFHSKPLTEKSNRVAKTDELSRLMSSGRYADYVDFNIPWNLNVGLTLTSNRVYSSATKRDTLIISQNLLFSGDFNLTPRWKLSFTSGYDFTNHALTLTSIDIYRDLHCWEMRLGTIPFGLNKNFNFSINVKASILQDLKLVRRRDYRDAL